MTEPVPTIPAEAGRHVRVFGTDYLRVIDSAGGQMYYTPFGWPLCHWLQPDRWYTDRRYAREGQRLAGGTGAVYRFGSTDAAGRTVDLVIKFSRFAQDVPLHIASTFPSDVPRQVADEAEFNTPFEEFGILNDLRRGRFGPRDLRILTKRPLAIYCPPGDHALRQLGRSRGRFNRRIKSLRHDQEAFAPDQRVQLDVHRLYVVIYGWVKGIDAQQAYDAGLMDEAAMNRLTRRSLGELATKGFGVLDHKPRHLIVRQRRDGSLLRDRRGRLAYALIDFELLQRTSEYEQFLQRQTTRANPLQR
jgi:hypothetical protein